MEFINKKMQLEIQIPNARYLFIKYFKSYVENQGKKFEWTSDYEFIAKWLGNNEGKGLMMYGDIGRGKSLIGNVLIPTILKNYNNRIVHCYSWRDLNAEKLEEAKKYAVIYIDDAGRENDINDYGNKHEPIVELIENSYDTGKILILSTNLNVNEFRSRYGVRTLDRLKEMMMFAKFTGKSLR